MKISYSWLKNYIDLNLPIDELSTILTDIGLEVGGIETFETIKGGLKGLVIGEVLTCEKHSNADSLSVTTVNVGNKILPIVCGAPNVAVGQKVVVATVGTTLYNGDDSFKIKKSKIRGEVSEGMICAEDEIGMGKSHDGILVLAADTPPGMDAATYFKVESDTIFEIDLTPNRVDGASHIGVARDIAAYLKSRQQNIDYQLPNVSDFKINNQDNTIEVEIKKAEACKRYSGVTISNLEIRNSPKWLQNRLRSIGLEPINNVVDATNFVLHELGQPLHAFDIEEIKGKKIIIDTLPKKTKFTTLDEVERELSTQDLMICNQEGGMCMAGVFGGLNSGVKASTKSIFLESAYFDAVWVRKTAKRHSLNTDASFRFERGTDPNITVTALKRATLLIQELAGGTISSEIIDIYPEKVNDFEVELSIERTHKLIGQKIGKEHIIRILEALEIKVDEQGDILNLKVPAYRVDVQREADVIEDILRIYGYNEISIPQKLNSSLNYSLKPDKAKIVNNVSDYLSANGFNEIMANSLTKLDYYEDLEHLPASQSVKINNPLSSDLNSMRQSLLFGMLESVTYNQNRKNADLALYEFGNCYYYLPKEQIENPQKNYQEDFKLALCLAGNKTQKNWNTTVEKVSFYSLKTYVEGILTKLRIQSYKTEPFSNDIWAEGLRLSQNNKVLLEYGIVNAKQLASLDIDSDVYFAEFNFSNILKYLPKKGLRYQEVVKYPEVRRDLALLVSEDITFADLKQTALKVEKKLLKNVDIFDLYKGDKIESGKKSYALSFIFQDETKTLNDKQIDKIISKLIFTYEKEFGAKLR